eukprot:TRINITY_DN8027_c0_g1_i1.p1 TRINITY_DN8027_c0_g1~~TRINITY_DN8027_c0_g1_i1.p1  ORF type:complete len:993 (-),score=174.92 TRINITY_DN8027_c0_g1_i1:97-3075(-)
MSIYEQFEDTTLESTDAPPASPDSALPTSPDSALPTSPRAKKLRPKSRRGPPTRKTGAAGLAAVDVSDATRTADEEPVGEWTAIPVSPPLTNGKHDDAPAAVIGKSELRAHFADDGAAVEKQPTQTLRVSQLTQQSEHDRRHAKTSMTTKKPVSQPSFVSQGSSEMYSRRSSEGGDRFQDGFLEMKFRSGGKSIQETDTDAERTYADKILYKASNAIAADKNVTFKFLGAFVCICAIIQAAIWNLLCNYAYEEEGAKVMGYNSYWDSLFHSLQLIMASGTVDVDVTDQYASGHLLRAWLLVQVFSGLVVFAIFVGFITDAVTGFMNELAEGRTKVVTSGHTLILGWNEATLRVVCQIAFMRRQYQIMNESWDRYWFPWRRLPPSTPIASADIVILSNRFEKGEMDEMLETAMSERGISSKRTKIGKDVICRVGDPTNPHDLVRVAATEATSILVMMTHRDAEEREASDGMIENATTIRTILALRRVLFSDQNILNGGTFHDDFRIIVQTSQFTEYMEAAYFRAPDGRQIIYPVDLSQFLNGLMFSCATQPGLAKVLMELFNFEKPSIRKRKVRNFVGGPDQKPGYFINKTFEEASHQVENCVLIGVLDPEQAAKTRTHALGDGIVPLDPENRRLQPHDLLIFIGLKSMPDSDVSGARKAEEYAQQASKVVKRASQVELQEKHVLVLGWRQVWSTNTKRFAGRIHDMVVNLKSGSSIVFINQMPSEDFIEIVRAYFPSLNDPADPTAFNLSPRAGSGTIVGRHVHGDASQLSVLRPLVNERDWDSAIVLSTQANKDLPPASCDMRVLVIMLQLRHLLVKKHSRKPLHVVGENSLDDTADLALPPRAEEMHTPSAAAAHNREADFINTQAIIARTLVQTLANPIINPAVSELFNNDPGLPFVYLAPADVVVRLNVEMEFGLVRHAVERHWATARTIVIGFALENQEPCIAPSKRTLVKFEKGDSIICIMRSLDDHGDDDEELEPKVLLDPSETY